MNDEKFMKIVKNSIGILCCLCYNHNEDPSQGLIIRIISLGRQKELKKMKFVFTDKKVDFSPAVHEYAEKKISKNEADLFESAFFKVEENGSYYIYEDLFATQRNFAVKKIFKLLELSAGYLEPVLDFRIATAESYEGFGNGIKFPSHYAAYSGAAPHDVQNAPFSCPGFLPSAGSAVPAGSCRLCGP